ncbi:MAG: hypothetical protein FGM14_12535 [Flavobacteriales bacterium]|nr:hypothetical protein [Flavobacteriales bacterium]
MREKLEKFIRENEVKIGEDFQLTTPNYYASLGEGFYHYFSTFKDKKNVYHFIVDKEDFNKSHGFEIAGMYDNIVLSILSFHRFLELYIKDVLRRINPYLAVKINPGIEDIFNFPSQIIPAENYHTIEFSESLKRLKKAFELNKLKGGIYQKNIESLNVFK